MSYLSLKIFKENQFVKTKVFTDDQISIGSSEGLSLQLEGISPWHVLIESKQKVFYILDLHSEEGTFVNGQKVIEETLISSGDFIRIGPYNIQFFIGPPTEKDTEETLSEGAKKSSSTPQTFETPSLNKEKEEVSSNFVEKTSIDLSVSKNSFQKDSKPSGKGFWNTYAPPSKYEKLEDFIKPSIGNLIEVIICWKERILFSKYFYKGNDVFIGNKKSCQIQFPNMLEQNSYKLLTIDSGAKVILSHGVTGSLFQGKDISTRVSHELKGDQTVILKPYEMIKLNFGSSLKIYIRLMEKVPKLSASAVFKLRSSEIMALFLTFLLSGLLFFYGSIYAPVFSKKDQEIIKKDIRIAKVVFKKINEVKLSNKTVKQKIKKLTQKKIIKKTTFIKPTKPVKLIVKKVDQKKAGVKKQLLNKDKKKIKTKSPQTAIKKGGVFNTKGRIAKPVALDPNKLGLLKVFGSDGRLNPLNQGISGEDSLLGIVNESTGLSGTEDEGEKLGIKTKEIGPGGRGSDLVGIDDIQTKGKNLNAGSQAKGLGERGSITIEFGTEDIDVIGEIDKVAILEVLIRNKPKVQSCYQNSLNQKPTAQGNLGMEWLILSDGQGQEAKAFNNDIGSDYLENCVARVLNSLKFPVPPSGQIPKVTFTFRFYL